ncbi:MAG: histidine kinase [Clostridia bacterium]|nr:histidine kinase [Clostridia bacterium]
MIDLFSRISIRRFVTIIIIFFILVFSAAATVVTYNYALHTFKNKYVDGYMNSVFAEIEQSIVSVRNHLNNVSLNLLSSSEIRRIINNDDFTYEMKTELLNQIFNNIITGDNYIGAIDFITSDDIVFRFGNTAIATVAEDAEFINHLSNMQLFIKNDCKQIDGNYYLPIGKKIYNYSTGSHIGNIIFYVDEATLGSSFSEFTMSKNIFFISVDDVIISHPEKKHINSGLYMPTEIFSDELSNSYDYQGYAAYENELEEKSVINKIKITGIISNQFLYSTINRITTIIFIIFGAILLVSIMLALAFSKNLIHHIDMLNKNIARFANDYTAHPEIHGDNEIIQLEKSFRKMTTQITNLISKIEVEKEKQRITEVNFLQSQINPHFIYNALDAISWKAKINKQSEIDDMVINLATFLRVGLHKGDNIISIGDELRHVESYIRIEKNRFHDLFDVEFQLEEGIVDKKTVKVILQPVVENCIIHGFKGIDYIGKIIIRAYTQGDSIIFEVEDNGCGMELCGDGQIPKSKQATGGYGLYNVNKRLQMYYGEDYGLSFESKPGMYTIVKIKIKNEMDHCNVRGE